MSPQDAVRLLIAKIWAMSPPFTEDDVLAALEQSSVPRKIAARAYCFSLISCGRTLFKDLGTTYSNEYFCFNANGDITETGQLDEEPYFVATNHNVDATNIGHPSLSHFALMAADVRSINDLMIRGCDPKNIVTTPSIVFLEPPTGVGMFKAQKAIALHNAEGLRKSSGGKAWWRFW